MPSTSPLSPAEALFLLKPNTTPGTRTLRVTLLSLLARGVLRIEERSEPGLFRARKVPHLRIAAALPRTAPDHVAAAIAVVREAQADGGRMRDVVRCAQRTFQTNCVSYNSKFIVPALTARGLIEERRFWFLRSYRVTPAGAAERDRIETDIARARLLPRMLRTDPDKAVALAVTLGGTLLLVDDLKKHYKQLAQEMKSRGVDSGGSDGFDGFDTGSADHHGSFDFGCLDLGGFDADAFGALDAGLSSFDSGFSDGGGGDGGDGGGGDGGGGGD